MKRIKALALAMCMLLSVTLFAACGNDGQGGINSGNEAAYKVKVVDSSGNPYTAGVIVRFLKNTEQVAMQTIDENDSFCRQNRIGDRPLLCSWHGKPEPACSGQGL